MMIISGIRLAAVAGAIVAVLWSIQPQPAHALSSCSFQGIQLFGEVTEVPSNADVKVEIVSGGADLKVQWVQRHADACGEWRRVGLGADFTIQIVPSGGDIRIQLVSDNPGLL